MTDDIFDESKQTEQSAADDQQQQSGTDDTNHQEPSKDELTADLLQSIQNEDGTPKYSDVATALESINPAQAHIKTIESENAELKEQLEKAKAAEELLRKAKPEDQSQAPQMSQEELFNAISTVLDVRTANDQKAANRVKVSEAFIAQYGDKANAEIDKLAKENGVGRDFIKSMSESAPDAVIKLAGLKPSAPAPVVKTPVKGTDEIIPRPSTEKPSSVMGGANTSDMVSAWRKAGEGLET